MSISFRILGKAGGDNALLVQIDSGQIVERLLFDCGDGCLTDVPFGDVQAIDHLFPFFRVEPPVSRRLPHRPVRAQLRHTVPQKDGFAHQTE
ncbi:hypothetical protein CfE428DRAFT_3366 [Chthoniobacter flavus Ellin428]|uniref:Uncharacterized protein n=1 Tax=Chthoniobacter flavus Ellin428 TaxID=497964 RepID=B4D378_9BACT|nr:hypothetical protein [Chthoniobacter flavus]EDY19189.1 hypothetical protein CfE428DRAFT_3366 [Chthoniobacter flavus Ellin428]TCO88034.1 hypothetical protein EV701_11977 [Chthoniobacter flavus]